MQESSTKPIVNDEAQMTQVDPLLMDTSNSIALNINEHNASQIKSGPLINLIGQGQADAMEMDAGRTISDQNYISHSNSVETVFKPKKPTTKCDSRSQMFGRFKRILGAATIERLNKLDGSMKRDSTFILECTKKLFGHDEQLKHVTAIGRKQRHLITLSTAKQKFFIDIFMERLSAQQIDETESNKRFGRLNALINNAINNILRVTHMCEPELISNVSI